MDDYLTTKMVTICVLLTTVKVSLTVYIVLASTDLFECFAIFDVCDQLNL